MLLELNKTTKEDFLMKLIRVALLFAIALLASGCGTRLLVRTTGFNIHPSQITVFNNAGPSVTVQPFSKGEGFVAEYREGKASPWCLWMCREQIPTKVYVLAHGQHLVIPVRLNNSRYYRDESISLLVRQNGKIVGTYTYCVSIPPSRQVTQDIPFGPYELYELKRGNPGNPCRSRGGWW